MGKMANDIIRKFKHERLLSYREIKRLYSDSSVKGVAFSSDGNSYFLKRVLLRNGRKVSFRKTRDSSRQVH